jgi:hypothetical protein
VDIETLEHCFIIIGNIVHSGEFDNGYWAVWGFLNSYWILAENNVTYLTQIGGVPPIAAHLSNSNEDIQLRVVRLVANLAAYRKFSLV